MNSKKFYLTSLGCPKNTVDSENMIYMLTENGYIYTDDIDIADFFIINTCGFIGDAKEESVNAIVEAAEIKNNSNKNIKLIVAGCLAQRYYDELKHELPEVDAFIGTGDFYKITEIADNIFKNNEEQIVSIDNIDAPIREEGRIITTPSYSAYIKLAEGCDKKCTYCIIPKIRGKQRSRRLEDIIAEAKTLAANGVKEIILIAQDVGEYGTDLYGKRKLYELLYELEKIDNLHWIRVMYIYPETITDDLIRAFKENDKILKYMDIPMQHINDRILKLMGRKTTGYDIINLIKKIRREIPGISLRSTFITSFPTETEKEHRELISFLKEYKLDRVGFFKYSREEGTPSYDITPQIDESIKEKRFNELMTIQETISDKLMERFLGKTLEVLIEEEVNGEEYVYIGRSYLDAPEIDGVVYVYSDKKLITGEFTNVIIDDSMEYDLIGRTPDESGK